MGRCILEVALFVTLLFFISCAGITGTPPNPEASTPGSAVVSASEGGEVVSPDGKLLLSIPPGALNEDTEISISVIESESGAPGYEFKPDGLVFNKPATAHMEIDLAEEGPMEDENGEALDITEVVPFLGLFLKSADGSFDALDNVSVDSEAGSSVVTVSAPIPHFSSLVGAVGNSYYVYMTSLGTHYVGSAFKADLDARYLGYSSTHSYKNMSLEYTVRSITVTKIKYEVSGAIKIVSPAEINRNAFLSQRGQTTSNRPKFNCDSVGSGTVKATVTAVGIVDVVFQPENKKLTYTVNQTESTTRKGKCIARVGFYQNGNSGFSGGEVLLALRDPIQDLTFIDGEPAQGLELPGNSDFSDVTVALHDGETLEVAFLLDGSVSPNNPEHLQYLNFSVGTLDEVNGYEGAGPYGGGANLFELEAIGPGSGFAAIASAYDPETGTWQERESQGSTDFGETGMGLLIPLSELGLSAEDLGSTDLRLFSLMNMANGYPYAGNLFADTVDLSI